MSDGHGALPEGWAWAKVAEVANTFTGSTPSRKQKEYFGGPIPFFKPTDLDAGYEVRDSTDSLSKLGGENARLFPADSVLVTCIGATIGKTGFARVPGATNQQINVVVPHPQLATPQYLYWCFVCNEGQNKIKANASATTLPILNKGRFNELRFRLPPLAEQRRIVSKIESLQERSSRARSALSEVDPLLEKFRQSVLAAAFRGDLTADWREAHPDVEPASELLERIRIERRERWEQIELAKYEAKGKQPPKNWQDKYKAPEPVNESDLSERPDGWCWCPLEDLATHQSGFAFKSKHFTDDGIQVVKLGNLYQGRFDLTRDPSYLPVNHEEANTAPVCGGDILVSQTGTRHKRDYGFFVRVPARSDTLLLNQRVLAVRPVDPSMVNWIIYSSRLDVYRDHFFSHETGGVNQGNVGVAGIMRGPVPIAPESEIVEISRRLEEAYASTQEIESAYSASEDELTRLDQSILAKAFRGELVPQDQNDEPASVLLDRIRHEREASVVKKSNRRYTKERL